VAAAALAPALLAACAGGGSSDSGVAMPAPEAGAPAVDGAEQGDREVIRNAQLVLRVPDVTAGADEVSALAVSAGGRVASAELGEQGEAQYASVVVRVPSTGLDDYLTAVRGLGTIESLRLSAEDVTAQAVDLDARIEALSVSLDRLNELLAQADTTADLIEIEREITVRQAELDSLEAQRAALSDAVALSTVWIELVADSAAAPFTAPGFLSGLESGWSALRSGVGVAITVVGFLVPFLVLVLIVAAPIVALVVWLRRRGRRV
jgi:hypothetical protein